MSKFQIEEREEPVLMLFMLAIYLCCLLVGGFALHLDLLVIGTLAFVLALVAAGIGLAAIFGVFTKATP